MTRRAHRNATPREQAIVEDALTAGDREQEAEIAAAVAVAVAEAPVLEEIPDVVEHDVDAIAAVSSVQHFLRDVMSVAWTSNWSHGQERANKFALAASEGSCPWGANS